MVTRGPLQIGHHYWNISAQTIRCHSRPQSRVPFGQRHGTKALAGTNLKSANRGLPVVLRRLGADPKIMADQM